MYGKVYKKRLRSAIREKPGGVVKMTPPPGRRLNHRRLRPAVLLTSHRLHSDRLNHDHCLPFSVPHQSNLQSSCSDECCRTSRLPSAQCTVHCPAPMHRENEGRSCNRLYMSKKLHPPSVSSYRHNAIPSAQCDAAAAEQYHTLPLRREIWLMRISRLLPDMDLDWR